MAAGGDSILKINDDDPTIIYPSILRESRYDLWNDGDSTSSDERENTTQESFHFRQKGSGDYSLDMDMEIHELHHDTGDGKLSPVVESPKANQYRFPRDVNVSFKEPASNVAEVANDHVVRRRNGKDLLSLAEIQRLLKHDRLGGTMSPTGDSEVLKCSSNVSFERKISMQGKSSLLKTKPHSRLLDVPEEPNMKSGRKVQIETKSSVLEYVTKILVCFLVGTLVWLVKTLVVKVLASSFHVSTYFDRIQESLFNQFVIETLSGPPLIELQKAEEAEKKFAGEVQKLQNAGVHIPPGLRETSFSTIQSGRLRSGVLPRSQMFSRSLSKKPDDGNDGITIDHLHKLNPKNVSAWNMKRLIKIVRFGALTTLHDKILGSTYENGNDTEIRSEIEAKAAAKKIFLNVSRHDCRYIRSVDLMRFMREDEVERTFNLFEGASDSGKISRSALKNWVVNAFRERRALALTLNDTKTAVKKLHKMLNFLVILIIVIIWLLILGITTTQFILFVSSQVLLVAFIFGNTCKTIFESIIFLFVLHPFDVGDRCEIDGVQMFVEEMDILTTTFLRYDFQRILIPNSVLATKAISNFYRSPDNRDTVEFCIHISTPIEKISAMKHRIQSYIDNKKEHWYASPFIFVKDCEQLNMVRMAVWPRHKMNFQDMGERYLRRSLLIEEMIKIFQELDLQYRLLPLDISIRSMPTTSDRLPPSWATFTS
ncbi:unnamed protein product [Lupinus luteus]|uniref:Mechanosensitive ion channel protein n=1 Tax=Lupinus luteus TaxID=3873 RepID=A0AAV1X3X7_LUPLU